ncbi:MAG: RraA family protein [Bryobacterales bacterium]|nr:RraA family protein [Bryobacterales bacterium]
MTEWNTDQEKLALVRAHLYSAVVGDICDSIGLKNQYLPPALQPIDRGLRTVLAGRVLTVAEQDITEAPDESQPWGLMLKALDSLKPDEIYVCSGASGEYALFGELMATAARSRGAAGAVCDGFVRDTHQIVDAKFPVFCRGTYGRDQRGRGTVVDFGSPLTIGAVTLERGDLLIGDIDGIIVVPKDAEGDVISMALAKVRTESEVRVAISRGMLAAEAFERYGVL